jgi:peptide/nickel transport system permease protein
MSNNVMPLQAATRGETVDASRSPRLWRRLSRRPLAVACLAFILGVIGIAIIAPILLPHVSAEGAGDLLHVDQGPSSAHLLGTDTLGRDVLNRLLVGTRPSVVAVAEALLVTSLLGIPLGLAAGYLGGWFDRAVSWLTDLSFSIPHLIVILVVISVFSGSTLAAMVTLGILGAPGTARMIRSVTLPVREELYVAAARVSGLTRRYIIGRHVLPRVIGVVITQMALFAAGAVGIEAGLAFLGAAGSPSAPSWGRMLSDGMNSLQIQSWLIWPPAIAIGLTVLALTLLGDVVRDATVEEWSTSVKQKKAVRARTMQTGLRTAAALHPHPSASVLEVEDLTVVFQTAADPVAVVEDVSFAVHDGEVVGIVGESGCGKTITAMAILDLLPGTAQIDSGRILYDSQSLTALSTRKVARLRGKQIALISQEPMVSLTPTFRVGWQIAEAVRRHHDVSRRDARERAIDLLRRVHLPEPELVARRYPHELSGGMAQRVAIARALAGEPKLLIADEPTTALDVTVQAEILDLLRELQHEREMAILLVTHDWGVIADLCDRVIVMYAGQVVEQANISDVFRTPLHPYTRALLASNPHHAVNSDLLPSIPGNVPSPGAWPQGCRFHPRCDLGTIDCRTTEVTLERPAPGRQTRCIRYRELTTTELSNGELKEKISKEQSAH